MVACERSNTPLVSCPFLLMRFPSAVAAAMIILLSCANAPAQDATKSASQSVSAPDAQAVQESPEKPAAAASLNEREQAFADQLTGAVLVGKFTVDGREGGGKPERYEIASARKLNDQNDWVIAARIKYGKYDLKVPVQLQVLWAGDTPVMSLTDLTIPLMGTFTARVLFYGDRYVGTWQHDKVGGHMFGKVEKSPVAAGQPEPTAAPSPEKDQ